MKAQSGTLSLNQTLQSDWLTGMLFQDQQGYPGTCPVKPDVFYVQHVSEALKNNNSSATHQRIDWLNMHFHFTTNYTFNLQVTMCCWHCLDTHIESHAVLSRKTVRENGLVFSRLTVMQIIKHCTESKAACLISLWFRMPAANINCNVSIAKDSRNPVRPVKRLDKCRIS